LLGRRADHDRDLLAILQNKIGRVAAVALAVDHREEAVGAAVPADAALVETNAPFGKELAERVRPRVLEFDVDDACVVVGVKRCNARAGAELDAP
jgi:hypothetical protein